MKRLVVHIIGCLILLPAFIACEQRELYLCPPTGDIPVNVIIHWDSVPDDKLALPNDMTVHWYPASNSLISSDMSVYGGQELLSADIYDVMCMDFNGNSNLAFRSDGTRGDFEVYNIRMTGTYNNFVPQLPGGETTVAEAYPYQFYIDSRSQHIDLENLPVEDEALTVHFYPKNVLREFTFLVYDVIGAKYMTNNSGAISGMSGSYFPADKKLASVPSTILFSRVETIKDAQTSSRWTEQEKALFAAKDPNWANPDTLVGWTRDWVTGSFVTFGPLDREENRFRLTVEAVSQSRNQYYGAWGYWNGTWENTVAAQIDSAMGENGTLEEQLAWRERNGGYDIILYNDHRLAIPDGEGSSTTDGGFIVSVDDWGSLIEVPIAGSSHSTTNSVQIRSLVNTYATIPDFVVNGIHKDAGDWSRIFDEQYVYKPESGLIWDYQPKKIWPQSGEVDFYAYAPAGIKNFNVGLNNNGDNMTPPILEYTMSYKNNDEPPPGTGEPVSPLVVTDNQEDLLVAVQNRTSPQTVAVPMNFRHAFSHVIAKAKTDQNYNDYRIKVVRVDLRNVYTSGKLQLNKDNTNLPPAISTGIPMEQTERFKYGAAGNVTLWYDLDSLANYRFNLLAAAVPIDDGSTMLVNEDEGIFVMPQVVQANAAVYVEYDVYTISPANGEQYYTSATKLLPLTAGFAFEIGRQYALQITLDIP